MDLCRRWSHLSTWVYKFNAWWNSTSHRKHVDGSAIMIIGSQTVIVTSAAYLDPQSEAEFGRIPPAFLPLAGQRLYKHQFEISLRWMWDAFFQFQMTLSCPAKMPRRCTQWAWNSLGYQQGYHSANCWFAPRTDPLEVIALSAPPAWYCESGGYFSLVMTC